MPQPNVLLCLLLRHWAIILLYYLSLRTHYSAIVVNILNHNGAGTNPYIIANPHFTNNLSACAYNYVVANLRHIAGVLSVIANCHLLVYLHITAYLGLPVNDYSVKAVRQNRRCGKRSTFAQKSA